MEITLNTVSTLPAQKIVVVINHNGNTTTKEIKVSDLKQSDKDALLSFYTAIGYKKKVILNIGTEPAEISLDVSLKNVTIDETDLVFAELPTVSSNAIYFKALDLLTDLISLY